MTYYFERGVVSVPDDVNIISKTSYAYHMKCKIILGNKVSSMYFRDNEYGINPLWICNMSYLGVK